MSAREDAKGAKGMMDGAARPNAPAEPQDVPPGYKRTEVGVVPEDWGIGRLGTLSSVMRGGSPRPIQNYITDSPEGINWIKIGDVGLGAKYIDSTAEKIIPAGITRSRYVKIGDFLLSNSMSFGRPYILRTEGCIHDGWLVIQDYHDHFDTEYLYYHLSSEAILSQYLRYAAGSSVLNLNKQLVSKISVAIPHREEQRAIAEALSDVDGLLAALEALIAKKRAIKQAAMQQLLTGKTRLPGFSGEWERKRIADIATLCNLRNKSSEELPVLTCSKHEGFIDSLKYFKNQVFSNDLSGYKVIYNGEIGYPANHIEEGSIGLQNLYEVALVSPIYVVFRPLAYMNSYFLHRLLKLESFRQKFATVTNSSVDRRGSLRWPEFSAIEIQFPSLAEQSAIAAVLSDMDAEIEALEARRDKVRAIKQGMMQQLLTGRVRLVKPEAAA